MKRLSLHFLLFGFVAVLFSSCSTNSNKEFAGREYMPDMAHSIAYEANHNTYYQFNTWGTKAEYEKMAKPRKPVEGTVAFNFRKTDKETRSLTYPNYNFPNTDEGREAAKAQILENPVRPENEQELEKILEKGKNLYDIYCASCHGEKGNGNGYLYREGEGPYSAAPANYLSSAFLSNGNTEGRYYHAIMHGKGAMLSHADKLNHDERWMVIHYIRFLQAKDKKEEYKPYKEVSSKSVTTQLIESDDIEEAFEKLLSSTEQQKSNVNLNVALKLKVLFDVGKSRVKSASRAELDHLYDAMKAHPDVKIEIGGHTDNTGDQAANKKLSYERAEAVTIYLMDKGIEASRLVARGYGDTKPVVSNDSDEGRKKNRRTEVKIIQ